MNRLSGPGLAAAMTIMMAAAPSLAQPATAGPSYSELRHAAEELYTQQAFERAYQHYAAINKDVALTPDQARWVRFRMGDCLWRAERQAQEHPSSLTSKPEVLATLEVLVLEGDRDRQHDLIWAEAQESLGDFYWTTRLLGDWAAAWPHYQAALDWWAASPQLSEARSRYLNLVWKIIDPHRIKYSGMLNQPGDARSVMEVLDNARRIAATDDERGRSHYLTAMVLALQTPTADRTPQHRISREFETALSLGRGAEWYAQALHDYAEWLSETDIGLLLKAPGSVKLDRARGLALYRRLLSESGASASLQRSARFEIEQLTEQKLDLQIKNTFLPGSQVEYTLFNKNLDVVDFSLRRIDLMVDLQSAGARNAQELWTSIDLTRLEEVRRWTFDARTQDVHAHHWTKLRVEEPLPVGAYLMIARCGEFEDRELVLVTDAVVVLKSSSERAVAYFCDALFGRPIAGATVSLWDWNRAGSQWHHQQGTTDHNGFCEFSYSDPDHQGALLAIAGDGNRQAMVSGGHGRWQDPFQSWRLHALTDRPAYRPGETVYWKIIGRTQEEQSLAPLDC